MRDTRSVVDPPHPAPLVAELLIVDGPTCPGATPSP
jgi:hypothetical protein